MPRKVFTAGEILTAADVNTNLMDQAVMVFADSTARGSAIPTPSEGMITYLEDTDAVEKYDGSNFVNVDTGKILQVVSVTKTDTFTTTAGSFVDVTGMAATITPVSASNKVLIVVQAATALDRGQWRLSGGNTSPYIGDAAGAQTRAIIGSQRNIASENGAVLAGSSIVFLDSPNTTSAVTYKLQAQSAISAFLNRTTDDSNLDSRTRGASSITLMEVAG